MKKLLSLLLVVILALSVLVACGDDPIDTDTGTGSQTPPIDPDDVWVDVPPPTVVTDEENFGTLPGDDNTQYDNVIVD